jgi:hypothetical protein
LKAGEWFRRGRLIMVSPVHGDYRRCQAEIPLIILCRFPGPALTSPRTVYGHAQFMDERRKGGVCRLVAFILCRTLIQAQKMSRYDPERVRMALDQAAAAQQAEPSRSTLDPER